MATQTSAVMPESVTWVLRNPRTREERTFEQAELTIEGEARLIGYARSLGLLLRANGQAWDDITALMNEDEVDWDRVFNLLQLVEAVGPDYVTDLACILLGIYPYDEDAKPNPEFDPTRRFIRSSIRLSIIADMVRVFISQNDYERLVGPFSSVLRRAAGTRTSLDAGAPSLMPSADVDDSLSNVSARLETVPTETRDDTSTDGTGMLTGSSTEASSEGSTS